MRPGETPSLARFAGEYLRRLRHCTEKLDMAALERVIGVLVEAWKKDRTIFVAGNGGSAATASHMANDLAKTVLGHNRAEPGALRAVALTDNVPLITAWGNDNHYDEVFSGQLAVLARRGDILLVISGSGNSPNILRAAETARRMGMTVVAFLGKGGGAMRDKADVALVVPSDDYGIIEDVHLVLNHLLAGFVVACGGMSALAAGIDSGETQLLSLQANRESAR